MFLLLDWHVSCFLALNLLLVLNGRGTAIADPQCRDDNDQPVDWYVLYKLPKDAQSSNTLIREGLAYLYITNNTVAKGWQLSSMDIGQKNSSSAYTLRPIYRKKEGSSNMWVLYNDDPPDASASGRLGHTKGVVLAGRTQGFWLIHSVPNFPAVPEGGETPPRRLASPSNASSEAPIIGNGDGDYDYPSNARNYGQSFLCISLGSDQFDVLATQLMYNQIIIYRRNIPTNLTRIYPKLTDAFNQLRITQPPYSNKAQIHSLRGTQFTTFAKTDKWQKELYDNLVAPQLKVDLLTETWLNGRGKLPSDCAGVKVFNVESVVLPVANISFTSSRDHSKWAVAISKKANRSWVCIGDINRADTQYNRGGGTVCLNLPQLWSNYRDAVSGIEPCPRSP